MRSHAIPCLALFSFIAAQTLCATVTAPADLLPPAPAWHGASEALVAKADNPWITPAEKMQLLDSPNYADTIAWLRQLADASPLIDLQEFGRTPQGRPLYVVVATKEKFPTPPALRTSGKPTLLAQGGIHSGEIDGKDAGLMLLRDIAFGGKDALLDHANFLFVPVFNADGHERSSEWNRPNQRGPVHQGWRTTAQNLNLNRDYVKADSPEMRAMLRLIQTWAPSLYLDLHVTDGIDYQYDITYGYNGWNGFTSWSPQGSTWLEKYFRPAVDGALQQSGHIPGPLIMAINNRDLTAGIVGGNGDPRFSTGYGDLRHLPSVLLENHSLKPYPQRVLGTYIFIESALAAVGAHAAELTAAIAADNTARPAEIPANWGDGGGPVTKMDFLGIAYEEFVSPASGVKEVRWLGTPKLYKDLPIIGDKPGVILQRPKAYYVPATESDVIAVLAAHGVRMETLAEPRTVEAEFYRLTDVKTATEPFEGHYTLTADVKPERRTETFPAGSVRITTDQPLGELAVVMLEPQSRDSLLAWGFFNEVLQRTEYIEGYVVAPMAEKMLADSPPLKAEFEAKLAADEKFAKDPTARLQWFYARSKFYDERYLLYPVGLER
ncbi:MAG: M14 family metallopeptidase [Opitutae bacterium]|nr:M14 family metallopeptidase [Opitutae bacterium]